MRAKAMAGWRTAATAAAVSAGLLAGIGAATMAGCTSSQKSDFHNDTLTLEQRAHATKLLFVEQDAGLQRFFDEAAGYVIFPAVGKGGFIVGGAHGEGVVYEDGDVIGTSKITQATIGAQIGGQSFREVIFFKAPIDVERFKQGNWEVSANVSAVAVTAGAAASADYTNGVAVFTMTEGGLMLEASVGGQKLTYRPKM